MTKKENQYLAQPPHDDDLEMAVLGAIMLEGQSFAIASQHLTPDVFYKNAHSAIFTAIISLFDKNEKIDLLTVYEELKRLDLAKVVGSAYELTRITNSVVSSAHLETHCKILLEFYLKRKGIEIAGALLSDCYEKTTDVFTVYNTADNMLIKAQERVMRGQIRDADFFAKRVYEEYETVKSTGVLGIQTGITPFDKLMCGLVAPDLVIVAARPGQGKTAFALSLTKNITIDRGIPCAWFSYEMSGTQLLRRLISQIGHVSHEAIRRGGVFEHKETDFMDAVEKASKANVYIEDNPTLNIRDIRTRAILLKKKHDIRYIIVDYIQLIPAVEKKQIREQQISEISRGLKLLAKELDVCIIALSQLNRSVEQRPDKIPQLSDLRESGSIEQDADSVLFLVRPEYYGIQETTTISGSEYSPRGLCLGVCGKNRHGETSNFPMYFEGSVMSIQDHPEYKPPVLLQPIQKPTFEQVIKSLPQTEQNDSWDGDPF